MTALGSRYAGDFFIYSLEWTANALVWRINNTEVFRQTTDIPQEPMYVTLSGGLDKPISSMTSLEIDWIRVYQPVK
jgi:beta-glucanase (GH16 family)